MVDVSKWVSQIEACMHQDDDDRAKTVGMKAHAKQFATVPVRL